MRYLMNHGSLAELRDRIYHKKKMLKYGFSYWINDY